jgi:hypothetical protein
VDDDEGEPTCSMGGKEDCGGAERHRFDDLSCGELRYLRDVSNSLSFAQWAKDLAKDLMCRI